MTRTLWAIALVVSVGCGGSRMMPGTGLEARHQQQVARLDRIEAEIAASEARAATARRAADYQECRAQTAAIEADIKLSEARCMAEVAEQQRCEAQNSERKAKSATGGCVLGILATAATGGTAAWALAGCGAGMAVGESTKRSCPVPSCVADEPLRLESVLADHGLRAMPVCEREVEVDIEVAERR